MRYLFATGALAFLIAGTSALAVAAPRVAPSAGVARVAVADSPDVAEWTNGAVTQGHVSGSGTVNHRYIARFASHFMNRTARMVKTLERSALRYLGTPYVFGGTSGYGFDCSGYTQHVFATLGVHLPRTADAQYYAGHRPVGGVKAGDLVFFQTYEPGPSHVGIYIGHGHFIHASSSHGVMVSSLSDSYWSARYLGAKRFLR